jgi:hypothetical protein
MVSSFVLTLKMMLFRLERLELIWGKKEVERLGAKKQISKMKEEKVGIWVEKGNKQNDRRKVRGE